MKVIDNLSIKETFEVFDLKESSQYVIKVKTSMNNIAHKAILFTGFKSGGYNTVYNNTYDSPVALNKIYSMKIVKKI